MNKGKKLAKVSMAVLALTLGVGTVLSQPTVIPTYANSTLGETQQTLIDANTQWSYLDTNTDPGTTTDRYAWTKAGYDLSSWKKAAGKFGAKNGQIADLGDGYIPTVLLNQYISGTSDIPTFFFRTTVQVDSIEDFQSITGELIYDDAAIVYINGKKVAAFDEPEAGFESNMSYGGSNAGTPKKVDINVNEDVLKQGENIIAVELHQGRESSSDIYFEMSNLQVNYGETKVEQKGINLTVGNNEESMNVTWYANSSKKGQLQIVKAAQLVNSQFPSQSTTIDVEGQLSNDGNYHYYQATINNLEENTKYAYRLVNEETISDIYTFETKDFDGSYSFILAGDPQIGASGNAISDTEGWDKTLKDSVDKFDPNFILSAGDQVNTASSESQYAGYLEHSQLTSVPQATTVGNHDSSSNAYNQHFNLPNETEYGKTTAGSDYWYVYNNTLFMDINTNNTSTAEHKAFMQEAIEKNSDVRWKVVVFHHSIYSVASHAVEDSILQRRQELAPVFDELGIDVVLMGHDHVYVRSHIMKGLQVSQKTTGLSSITDPDGILYVTANSASGSKYYDIKTNISTDFVDTMDQSKQRSISHIQVSENEFKITTYLYNSNTSEWTNLDQFSIIKSAQTNDTETILKDETTSVNVEVNAPAKTIEKDSALSVTEIKEGSVYDSVKTKLKEQPLTLLDVQLIKDKAVVQPLNNVTVRFSLPQGYTSDKIALYRLDNLLTEVAFQIVNDKITFTTNQLGQFVIVDLTAKEENISNNLTNQNTNDKEQQAENKPSSNINTGDNTHMMAYTTLLFTALGCSVYLKKRKSEE